MNKKLFFSAILAIVLVFGMAVIGCDNDPDNGGDNGGQSLPAASGNNAVSGKTYFEWESRTVFSVTASNASNGTYTVGRAVYNDETYDYELENGKYKYADNATGTYTWNEGAKTVTLKPERVAGSNSTLIDKTAYRSEVQTFINQYKQQNGETALNQQLSSMGFSSVATYIDYAVNEAFANKTNIYSFSNDGVALFLEKALPVNKGANEFSGQTYYGMTSDSDDNRIKDTNQVYVFTSSGYTFTENYSYGSTYTETGSYAYDSSQKRVWLKPSTINGKDRNAYYTEQTEQTAWSGHKFVDDNAYYAAQTNDAFSFGSIQYNSTNKTIGWEDGYDH